MAGSFEGAPLQWKGSLIFAGGPPPGRGPSANSPGSINGNSALIFNQFQKDIAVSVPTIDVNPAIGSAGATGNPGATAAVSPLGATTTGMVALGSLSAWQMNNQPIDTILRVGLPVLAFFAWRGGHRAVAVVAAGGAGVLWANRLTGINL